jgi:hypothetical protein
MGYILQRLKLHYKESSQNKALPLSIIYFWLKQTLEGAKNPACLSSS